MKKIIQKLLLIIGVIILIIFIKNIDLKIISLSFTTLGIKVITILFLYVAISVIVKAVRWQFLMKKITDKFIPLRFSVMANLAGIAGGSLMPGRIDLVKPLMMKTKHDIRMSYSLSALMIERALDLLTLLLIAGVSLFLIPSQSIIKGYLVFIFILAVILVMILLVFFPKFLIKIVSTIPLPINFKKKVEEFTSLLLEGFKSLKSKKFVFLIMFLSIITIGMEVLRFYFLMKFLNIPVTITIAGFTLAVAVIIGVLTMIPGGVGITEISTTGILTALTLAPTDIIKSVVLIDRFIAYYLLLLIGSLILIYYSNLFKTQ